MHGSLNNARRQHGDQHLRAHPQLQEHHELDAQTPDNQGKWYAFPARQKSRHSALVSLDPVGFEIL